MVRNRTMALPIRRYTNDHRISSNRLHISRSLTMALPIRRHILAQLNQLHLKATPKMQKTDI